MICLHCGHCCRNYAVVIVDDPTLGIQEDNLILHEGRNVSCKHLKGDKKGEYMCAIHNKEWYDQTPCFQHTQIESGNSICRFGNYVMNKTEGE